MAALRCKSGRVKAYKPLSTAAVIVRRRSAERSWAQAAAAARVKMASAPSWSHLTACCRPHPVFAASVALLVFCSTTAQKNRTAETAAAAAASRSPHPS